MLVSKQNFNATVSKAHVPFFLLQLAFAVKTSSKHKAGVWARPAMAMLWSCHVIWLTVYIDLHWLTLTYCNTYSDYLRLTLLLILMRYVMILLILTVFCVGTSRLQSTETPRPVLAHLVSIPVLRHLRQLPRTSRQQILPLPSRIPDLLQFRSEKCVKGYERHWKTMLGRILEAHKDTLHAFP